MNNEQFHLRTFDFPIVLLSKCSDVFENSMGQTPRFEDLLVSFTENEFSALKAILNFKNNKSQILGKKLLSFSIIAYFFLEAIV